MKRQEFSLKPYYSYFVYCGIYFFIAGFILLFTQKGQPEIFINQHWHPYLDTFFKYYTNAGDGWFYTAFNLLLLLVGFYEVLLALISILITTSIIHLFKEVIFHGVPRPTAFLPKDIVLHLVDGVDIHVTNSFPSGHTCTGFCMAMIAVFLAVKYLPNYKYLLSFLIFLMAFLIGFSRIYLMQHFLVDTFAGTFIGSFTAFAVIFSFEKYTHLKSHSFWKRSLLQLKK